MTADGLKTKVEEIGYEGRMPRDKRKLALAFLRANSYRMVREVIFHVLKLASAARCAYILLAVLLADLILVVLVGFVLPRHSSAYVAPAIALSLGIYFLRLPSIYPWWDHRRCPLPLFHHLFSQLVALLLALFKCYGTCCRPCRESSTAQLG